MEPPPLIEPMTAGELRDLARAKALLENQRLAIRLAGVLGSPIEKGFALLPKNWSGVVNEAAHRALMRALSVAVRTLGKTRRRPARERLHKALAGTSGGIGGAFGLMALPVELPISTTIMLRSIADIARDEGHDLSNIETRLECLQVFALGGGKLANAAESVYWATRAAVSQSLTEAASYLAQKGLVREGAPAIAQLITQIASRFGVVVSEEMAAKALPIVGAVGGSVVNVIFLSHFQDMARGHFIIRRLESRYGLEAVRAAYYRLNPGR